MAYGGGGVVPERDTGLAAALGDVGGVEAELAAAEEEVGAGAAGATAEAAAAEPGSESDKAGEGDVVGETEAPKSETPAE